MSSSSRIEVLLCMHRSRVQQSIQRVTGFGWVSYQSLLTCPKSASGHADTTSMSLMGAVSYWLTPSP
eukprot:6167118-Amphidinium_carterae.1